MTPSCWRGSERHVPSARSRRCLLLVAILGLSWVGSASAQTCVDDVTGRSNNCTANDVQVASVTVLGTSDPCSFVGDTATLDLRLELVAGAAERYDIGLFLAQNGVSAFTGQCAHNYLPAPLAGIGLYNPTSGSGPYYDAEGGADVCGDIEQGVSTFLNIFGVNITCVDLNNDGLVDIPSIVSWDNNMTGLCTSSADAVPGTVAKCRGRRSTSRSHFQPRPRPRLAPRRRHRP